MSIAFVVGFFFGFVGSMPIAGPIAVLVFTRAIEHRPRSALGIALGCGVAEAIYAFLAFWGFSTFLAQYPWVVPVSRGVAAAVLLALGIAFVRRRHEPAAAADESPREGIAGGIAVGFTVTALNPTLIATWAAATTTLFSTGLVDFRPSLAYPFGIGACVGIAGWFAILILLVRRYKSRFKQRTLLRVIQFMGVGLIGLAAWFALSLLSYFFG